MQRYKLSNVLLKLDDHIRRYPQMLYRASSSIDYQDEDSSLAFEGSISFLTYFNSFSAAKWRKYAAISQVSLHLELLGDACEVMLLGIPEADVNVKDAPDPAGLETASLIKAEAKPKQIAAPIAFAGSADYQAMVLDVPVEGMLIVGFALRSQGATAVRNAFWQTKVPQERIRHIRIAIATTTFKNEDYIIPNIQMIRRDVLESDDPVADALHMFVVDNGQTLDAEGLSGGGVTVLPNANEGGSAGFARGMLEALESDEGFTHVLLMDDDVRVSPESIIRTFNLLSLTTDAYKDAFINGAMLEIEHPNKQFEDVSNVLPSGLYFRLKGNLFMDTLIDVAMNEVIDVEVPNAYGAWWYSCIPLSALRANGLPLPIFVRCDDVEFGMRCKPTYMTMNGICVWHAAFTHKFRAPVDSYQYIRNYLIMNAIHGISSESLFLARATRSLQLHLRAMAYETADLMVKGFEDYLKGPEWLGASSGEAILKANNASAEKMLPLDEALAKASDERPDLASTLKGFQPDANIVREDQKAGPALRLFRTVPYDRHLLPDAMLRDKPATAYYGGYTVFSPDQMATRVLVACDRDCETAHVRFMDRARWRDIRRRWADACAEHRKHGKQISRAYRSALPNLTSPTYWRDHLGLGE